MLLALALVAAPAQARAEWQIKPFVGATFAGTTTYLDLERAAGRPNVVVGVTAVCLGEVLGVDAGLGYAPGFFQSGHHNPPLVLGSSVTTVTGNLVIAMPRRLMQYTLRPYLVGGAGFMHVRIDDAFAAIPVSSNLPTVDFGGGVVGFLTNRVGVGWELRRFKSIRRDSTLQGVSFGSEELSFWRANMALVFRY